MNGKLAILSILLILIETQVFQTVLSPTVYLGQSLNLAEI